MARYIRAVWDYLWPPTPPPPPPPTLTENPWRKLSNRKEVTYLQHNQIFLDEINELQPKTKQNLLILGQVCSGKSSFINSVVSIDKGHRYGMVMTGNFAASSWTLNLAAYSKGKILRGYRLFDCKGIEPSVGNGIHLKDLLFLIKGHIRKGYTFNAEQPISETNQFYTDNPKFKDKMHCVIFVVSAVNVHAGIGKEYVDNIKSLQYDLRDENIPRVMILTKVDVLCDEVAKDATKMFKSIKVRATVKKASELFGIEKASIHPVINYEGDSYISPEINIPILLGLRQAMHYSAHKVELEDESSDDSD